MMGNKNKKIKPGEILIGKLEMHGKICEIKSAQPKEHSRPQPYKKGPGGSHGSILPMIDCPQGAFSMYPQCNYLNSACEFPNTSTAFMYPSNLHPTMMQMYHQGTHYGSPMYRTNIPPYPPEYFADTGYQLMVPLISVPPVPFVPPVLPLTYLAPVASLEQHDSVAYSHAPPILGPTMSPMQASVTQHAPTNIVMHEEGGDIKLG